MRYNGHIIAHACSSVEPRVGLRNMLLCRPLRLLLLPHNFVDLVEKRTIETIVAKEISSVCVVDIDLQFGGHVALKCTCHVCHKYGCP